MYLNAIQSKVNNHHLIAHQKSNKIINKNI